MAGAETIHHIIQDLFGEISDDEQDGGTNPEKEGKAKSEGETELKSESVPKVLDHCQARSSRSPDNEKNTYQAVLSIAALSDVLRDYGCDRKMATVSASNIVGIDPKLFDPSTYVEEDLFMTDTSGFKRRIPSNNIICWRKVTNPDGTTSVECNIYFVTWSNRSVHLFEMKASMYLNTMLSKFNFTFSLSIQRGFTSLKEESQEG